MKTLRATDEFASPRWSYEHTNALQWQRHRTMTTPKVTEIRRPLQAVTRDPFIAAQMSPPRKSAPPR